MHPLLQLRSAKLTCLALSTLLITSLAQAAPQIRNIGHLPMSQGVTISQAQGISENGQVVIGFSTVFNDETETLQQTAFRWTPARGIQALPYLTGGGNVSAAQAVTPDGNVAVGFSDGRTENGTSFWSHAIRWQTGKNPQDLGTLPNANESAALGVSRRGDNIVGYSKNQQGELRAVLWHQQSAPRDLGTLGGTASMANGITHDGAIVIGVAQDRLQRPRAFTWSARDGMKDLGTLPGMTAAIATAISASGETIVGCNANSIESWINPHAEELKGFIWRRVTNQMQEIVNTLGGLSTLPLGVSHDGQQVVGVATDAHGQPHAFLWTPQGGMTVEHTLSAEPQMVYARGLSSDGRYSAGRLANNHQAFRAKWR